MKILLIAAATLLSLFVLLLVALLLFIPSKAFEEQMRTRVLPRISQTLGREVSVESIDASVFPRPALKLEGLRIAGSTRPLLVAKEARAHPRLWPLIRSLGKEVRIASLDVVEPEVNVVRLADGTWDLPRMPRRAPRTAVDVQRGRIRDGTVRLIRQADGRELALENLQAEGSWVEKGLRIGTFQAEAYGGRIRADDSHVYLSGSIPSWDLLVAVDGLHLDELPARAFDGRFGLKADLEGAGSTAGAVLGSLDGMAELVLRQATWRAVDLEAAILERVTEAMSLFGLLGEAPRERPRGTAIGDATGRLQVKQGWVRLEEPIPFRTSYGSGELSGRIALDRRLDMRAKTELPPKLLAELSGGRVETKEAIPVNVDIGGTLERPTLSQVDLTPLLPVLAGEAVRHGLEKVIPKEFPKAPKLPF